MPFELLFFRPCMPLRRAGHCALGDSSSGYSLCLCVFLVLHFDSTCPSAQLDLLQRLRGRRTRTLQCAHYSDGHRERFLLSIPLLYPDLMGVIQHS